VYVRPRLHIVMPQGGFDCKREIKDKYVWFVHLLADIKRINTLHRFLRHPHAETG